MNSTADVVIIGAGPSGAAAAAHLVRNGHSVIVLEREYFPRFSIGESLLPQCMTFLEEAGLCAAVDAAGFQVKTGASFRRGSEYFAFDFSDKFTEGPATTYQVQRARFDKILADEAARIGADIRYGATVTAVDFGENHAHVTFKKENQEDGLIKARFCLDASGYGRTLPRLLNLDRPSSLPPRMSVFTHLETKLDDPRFERDKILITVHPDMKDVWYWTIPFSNGTCSVGVVGLPDYFPDAETSPETCLRRYLKADPVLAELLSEAPAVAPVRFLKGYAASVSALSGPGFALLGNAAEFLDPVFSSGVTVALQSAILASRMLDRQLRGEAVDWKAEYDANLIKGVETFRTYVETWYDGRLQDIFFRANPEPKIVRMISSILAGYAWDQENPMVSQSRRRVNALAELCKAAS